MSKSEKKEMIVTFINIYMRIITLFDYHNWNIIVHINSITVNIKNTAEYS